VGSHQNTGTTAKRKLAVREIVGDGFLRRPRREH